MIGGPRPVKSKGSQSNQRNFVMPRIHHPSKRSSHLTLWLGLLAAVAVVAAVLFYGNRQAEQKKAGTFNYLRPVPSDSVLRSTLQADQYHITRENGTETPFGH